MSVKVQLSECLDWCLLQYQSLWCDVLSSVSVCYSVSAHGNTLTLLSVTEEDSGTYTCLAVSSAGQESRSYTLFVLGLFLFPLHTTSQSQAKH